jgi:hypothetical protein
MHKTLSICITPNCNTHLGPLHTQDWEPMTITLQALSLVEKAELVQVRFTLHSRDQHSMWMQDGCKAYMDSYMDSYMASNGSCSMVSWIIFNNHLLEVGLTQIQETMALRTLTTVGLFYFHHVYKFIEIAFGWGPSHVWLHTTLEDPWPTLHDFEGVLGWPLDTFLWALTISCSWLSARVWSGPHWDNQCSRHC